MFTDGTGTGFFIDTSAPCREAPLTSFPRSPNATHLLCRAAQTHGKPPALPSPLQVHILRPGHASSSRRATPTRFALLQVARATVKGKPSPLVPQPTLQQRVGGRCRQWLPLRHSEEERMRFAVVPIIQTAELAALYAACSIERAGVKYHC